MISVFEHEPYWPDYEKYSANTQQVEKLYKKLFSDVPSGFITKNIKYNGISMNTPLKQQILDSDFQNFFFLKYIAFDKTVYGRQYVDIWLLAENMTPAEQEMIQQVQALGTKETPVCCFKGSNNDDGEFSIEKLISGFARIIVHSESTGIDRFMEGRFLRGQQYDFGRLMVTEPTADEKRYINDFFIYTGWWPEESKMGQGIGIIDNIYFYQGEWQPVADFPNDGRDIYAPQMLYSYDIYDLSEREMYRGFFGKQNYELIQVEDDTVKTDTVGGWWTSCDRFWNNCRNEDTNTDTAEEEEDAGEDDGGDDENSNKDYYLSIEIHFGGG